MAFFTNKLNSLIGSSIKTLRSKLIPSNFYISIEGKCPSCEKKVVFSTSKMWLRDYLLCPYCQSLPRERTLTLIIEKYFPNWRDLKIYEPSGSPDRGISKKLQKECLNYTTSQFYINEPVGKIINGERNESLENLTFEDNSFDIVITQDVLEHVYNPEIVFQEIARVLKPGGMLFSTLPLQNKFEESEVWAIKGTKGEPIFLKTPDFHGPADYPEAFPVTMHWGYDIVDFIRNKSSLNAKLEFLEDLDSGIIMAQYNEVLVAKK